MTVAGNSYKGAPVCTNPGDLLGWCGGCGDEIRWRRLTVCSCGRVEVKQGVVLTGGEPIAIDLGRRA